MVAPITGPWAARTPSGEAVDVPCPGDWSRAPGFETFAGTLRLRTEFALVAEVARRAHFLDLGAVGDIAEVFLNGQCVGVRGWRPYVFAVHDMLRRGGNALDVLVTNSMANRYDGLQLRSGIMGPVVLRQAGHWAGGTA